MNIKAFISIFLGMALLPLMADARILTADPYPPPVVPTHFMVVIDGGVPINSPAQPGATAGSMILSHNIDSLATGNHTAKAQACDANGCSQFSTPDFAFAILQPAPVNIRCEPVCAVVAP